MHSPEQMRKKAEAMAESKMHMEKNVVGDKPMARGMEMPMESEMNKHHDMKDAY